jgi:hypothetical protein
MLITTVITKIIIVTCSLGVLNIHFLLVNAKYVFEICNLNILFNMSFFVRETKLKL